MAQPGVDGEWWSLCGEETTSQTRLGSFTAILWCELSTGSIRATTPLNDLPIRCHLFQMVSLEGSVTSAWPVLTLKEFGRNTNR